MAVPIRMPDLGTTVDEVELVAWLVLEGEPVKRGQPVAEVETDKAASELESVAEGTLLKHVVAEGESVQTGDVLAYVGEPGEVLPEPERERDASPAANAQRGAGSAIADRAAVAPIVRNLARELGVDPEQCAGGGVGGVVTREDVRRAAERVTPRESAQPERLSRRQAAVARAVQQSIRTIPHLRLQASIDVSALERVRAAAEPKVSYDAFFLKAMAEALKEVPLVAARLDADCIVRPDGLHIAVAVGVGDDLFLPVVRNVDRKPLHGVHQEIVGLAERARRGKLRAEEMTGGCMALSNLGMYPVDTFDAIIFPEHSCILTVGAVKRRALAVGDALAVRPTAVVRLAADHRLINGRVAARFLAKLRELIEEWR